MKKSLLIVLCACITAGMISSCMNKGEKDTAVAEASTHAKGDEKYRPAFHFTPKKNWMNDPNGMFYLNGTYHLFFQHYPDGNTWGPMHWGHATSKDLIQWEEQPIALFPDEKGYIFSGSAVVDTENTSGLGDGITPPIIAMFTYHDMEAEKAGEEEYQTQAIAYSLDEGKTFTKYSGNPVIENPGIRDFRDPKMTWDEERQQWLMVLSADDKSMIYRSANLLEWELLSEFGKGFASHGGVWECPDFFPMNVEGTNEEKWVLIQSLNPGAYNGGSGTQYFVGEFDGKTFTPDESMADLQEDHSYWLDFGKDNYAGVTWSNIPESDGRTLFIGWMSNWQYANVVPTETWRSANTVPRELSLQKVNDTYRIFSQPVSELSKYFEQSYEEEELKVQGLTKLLPESANLSTSVISFQVPQVQDKSLQFFLSNTEGDTLKFGFDHMKKEFFLDRSKSGLTDFSEHFGDKQSLAPRTSASTDLEVKVVIDKMSIEIFFDKGETVMTEIVFPKSPYNTFSANGEKNFIVQHLKHNELKLN